LLLGCRAAARLLLNARRPPPAVDISHWRGAQQQTRRRARRVCGRLMTDRQTDGRTLE